MDRYVCIHGHFYQPPRENPWLETIESQESAHPYHDWNERITAECYAPNAAARILDSSGLIDRIVSNYERMSFNFGPTLLSWLEVHASEIYQAILEADLESQRRFSGHGSALAQAYNHIILPLANHRDRKTQILWGIRDFEHRFRRRPEGLWLPETAVDIESLEYAAESGIQFTILEPHQAKRVRRLGEKDWRDVSRGGLDTSMPYTVSLPSGRTIAVFFYDGPRSRAIAFDRLLRDGEVFAQRLLNGFSDTAGRAQLVHVATDGETYGHHHQFGEMALAYTLHHFDRHKFARITNYGEFLERHPPTHEVEIAENTSWSCAHGIERWRSDCGCNSGGQPKWHQAWRAPLREALDWLRDKLAPEFDRRASEFVRNPWEARNEYIDVILDRSPESVNRFVARHGLRPPSSEDQTTILQLMELQRHAMLMYTSCGWFFDDISGIETIQILQYAGRAMQLAEQLFDQSLESRLLTILRHARSNVPSYRDGRRVYERHVTTARVTLQTVAAHYAVRTLLEEDGYGNRVACYEVDCTDSSVASSGRTKLGIGRARIRSSITGERAEFAWAVLHSGDIQITAGVTELQGEEWYGRISDELREAVERDDRDAVRVLIQERLGGPVFTFETLFKDEKRRILDRILQRVFAEAESTFAKMYDGHLPLMKSASDLRLPLPDTLRSAAGFALNARLRRALGQPDADVDTINAALDEMHAAGVEVDSEGLKFVLQERLESLIEELFENSASIEILKRLNDFAGLDRALNLGADLRRVQNYYYELRQWVYPEMRDQGSRTETAEWLRGFVSLGRTLGVRVGLVSGSETSTRDQLEL